MSILPTVNGPATKDDNDGPPATTGAKPKKPRKNKPNLNQIHSRPLPLEAYPLPAFHPSNPISLLRLIYTWISDVLFPPTSHPARNYVGYFSPETRSIHVTDPRCIRVLWEMGFFGKGTLSRSEPTWIEREKARLEKERDRRRGVAAEDVTNARRDERRLFKLERARLEWEKVEEQRKAEAGEKGSQLPGLNVEEIEEPEQGFAAAIEGGDDYFNLRDGQGPEGVELVPTELQNGDMYGLPKQNGHPPGLEPSKNDASLYTLYRQYSADIIDAALKDEEESRGRHIDDQEHLQLTFEESFFLCYGLGVLSICPPKRRDPSPLSVKTEGHVYSTSDLLELFCQYSSFPPADSIWITPDDQFLLNYVAYHHFRSLGWVVRPGIKFSVDYLLYNRGPPFAHAEFAVLVIPSYTDRYWNTPGGRARRRIGEEKDWWWLHCVNRVQSQVLKSLVLCYIDIPSELDLDFDEGIDVGKLLRSFRVREFVVRRWVPSRNRD